MHKARRSAVVSDALWRMHTGRGDGEDVIAISKVECLAIRPRVFPRHVVNVVETDNAQEDRVVDLGVEVVASGGVSVSAWERAETDNHHATIAQSLSGVARLLFIIVQGRRTTRCPGAMLARHRKNRKRTQFPKPASVDLLALPRAQRGSGDAALNSFQLQQALFPSLFLSLSLVYIYICVCVFLTVSLIVCLSVCLSASPSAACLKSAGLDSDHRPLTHAREEKEKHTGNTPHERIRKNHDQIHKGEHRKVEP